MILNSEKDQYVLLANRHRRGKIRRAVVERLKDTSTTLCWIWAGNLSPSTGYGRITLAKGKVFSAHRLVWLLFRGEIPKGMMLDHMCRVRRCVNPNHLRIVSPRINSIQNSSGITARNAAKTHCLHGHEFTVANTHFVKSSNPKTNGQRLCKVCIVARNARYKRRRRVEPNA